MEAFRGCSRISCLPAPARIECARTEGTLPQLPKVETALALGAGPAGGRLSGTLTRPAVNGIATFTDLRIDKPGAGYTLRATTPGLPAATSAAFTVAP